MILDTARWQDRLDALAVAHRVPGAALGIMSGPDRLELATGVLSLDTQVPATPESIFQIGSLTKVWTATVIMGLVADGLIDLDAPVRRYLPDFAVADDAASAAITMRHLLTHASGFDGDVFTDTGRGDDCLERYVALLVDRPQLFPAGVAWSYNNAGFDVAGRVAEVVTRTVWDDLVRTRIIEPLGLRHTVTLPEQALLHRAAVGHVTEADDSIHPTGTWALPRSSGPAGSVIASVGDELDFVRMHLDGGRPGVLSAEHCEAMASAQVQLPAPYVTATSWGLGWARYRWDGRTILGHNGATIGQNAFLRVHPAGDRPELAVVLLTNGGRTQALYAELFAELFAELGGIAMPAAPAPDPDRAVPTDHDHHDHLDDLTGSYTQASARLEIRREQGGLVLRHIDTTDFVDGDRAPWECGLIPTDPAAPGAVSFLARGPHDSAWSPVTFSEPSPGVRLLYSGGRAHPRTA